MEKTIKKATIGTVLTFNETDFEIMVRKAGKIIPAIQALKKSFKDLGLNKIFTNDLFQNLMQQGALFLRPEFEEMVKADLSTYKNPISVKSALDQIDTYLHPVQDAVNEIHNSIDSINRENANHNNPYTLSANVYSIEDEEVLINEADIKEHFTERIESESKLNIYNQLLELEEVYNKTTDVLSMYGAKIPLGGLIGNYLSRETYETGQSHGLTKGNYVRVNKGALNRYNGIG